MLHSLFREGNVARYKEKSQDNVMVPINLKAQLLPGTFEFTLNEIVDNHLDLSLFDSFFHNDDAGPKAYPPQALLKVVLFGYSKGLLSSRRIEEACKSNVLFMALSGEIRPDHSTIASFVSSKAQNIKDLFVQVLAICAQLDLVGVEMFALDGCKLPSNAAREHSATFAEYRKKLSNLQDKIDLLMKQHIANDQTQEQDRIGKAVENIQHQKRRIQEFLRQHQPRTHTKNREVKSNLTDNDSAKLKCSGGYIQGYNALALADSKHQIIVNAYPIGRQYEGDELKPFVKDSLRTAKKAGILKRRFRTSTLLADTNYFSEANCRYLLQEERLTALIPDPQFRRRDPHFPQRPSLRSSQSRCFRIQDFSYDALKDQYRCPNGKALTFSCKSTVGHYRGRRYHTGVGVCDDCPFTLSCLRKGARLRSLFVIDSPARSAYSHRMIQVIDSSAGRQAYARRMAIIEPVFANIKSNKRMNRFTLRGIRKVSQQWLLYCLVHNIEKITTTGAADRLIET